MRLIKDTRKKVSHRNAPDRLLCEYLIFPIKDPVQFRNLDKHGGDSLARVRNLCDRIRLDISSRSLIARRDTEMLIKHHFYAALGVRDIMSEVITMKTLYLPRDSKSSAYRALLQNCATHIHTHSLLSLLGSDAILTQIMP